MPVTHDIKKAMPDGSQIQSHVKYNIETLVKMQNYKKKTKYVSTIKIKVKNACKI